jgi:phosphonate metabolism-associated iron-containing alcohol dehydrogenase
MEYYNPVRLILGSGARAKIVEECIDRSVLIFCTASAFARHKKDHALNSLIALPNIMFEHAFSSNPSLLEIEGISRKYLNSSIDLIVGLGGGSAMDAAKIACVSIPAYQKGLDIDDLLTDSKLFCGFNSIDCIQVPTTAGTGSEVTPFATVWDYTNQQKKSLSNPAMFAKTAIIDPDFLYGIPLEISISTGLDALNQAFESIWNVNANECSRSFSRMAAELALQTLPLVHEISNSSKVREKLAKASLFAGLAISQTRTSICHSISYPLTLKYGMPHGIACAFSMLEVYKFNAAFIKEDLEIIAFNLKQDPYAVLENIFSQYNLNTLFAKTLPNKRIFTDSIDDFITAGRFENNIKNCNRSDLVNIISASYKSALSLTYPHSIQS